MQLLVIQFTLKMFYIDFNDYNMKTGIKSL